MQMTHSTCKRFMALFLTLVMLLSLMPTAVFAADAEVLDAEPDELTLVAPDAQETVEPEAVEPTEPEIVTPVEPEVIEPTEPDAVTPEESQSEIPAEPQLESPAEPQEEAPMEVEQNNEPTIEGEAQAPTYEFGSAKTKLLPGKYDLPLVMNKADKPNQSSMASSCIKGAVLIVAEDGSAKVTINLGAVTVTNVTGWGSNWKVYTENNYTNPDALIACEYTINDQGEADSITFAMPDNSWDGVYTHMYIAVMGLEQDAYFKMDFANATPFKEPVPVTFSAGANGTLVATVNNKEIKSGDLVKSGAKVIFTAKADAGYVVDTWTGVDATGNSVAVTADKALNVSVTFTEKVIKNYVVNFSAGANGTLTATVDGKAIQSGAEVVEGSTVIFTAAPADGYLVDAWNGVTGDGNSANAIVNGELNVNVTFKLTIDRTELDKAIAEAEAKVAAPMDYPDDANWAAMLSALENAKNPDLITNTALANHFAKQLNDASAKVVKLDKTAFSAAYDNFGVSWRGKSYAGYPKAVTMPCDEVVKLAQTYDSKRAQSQAEIDAVTEQMVAVYNDLQAYIQQDIKLANIKHNDGTETAYLNVVEAIKAFNASNDTAVILLKDLELADPINGKRVTFDLNGFTLSVDGLVQLAQLTSSKANAVLNANLKFSAEVNLGANLTINGQIYSKAKITIDGATINAPKGSDAFGFERWYCIPEIVVNSGTITAADGYAIPAYINSGRATQITINNGTLVGKDYAVKGISPVTINGGQFKAAKGAVTGADVVVPEGQKLSHVADENGFFKLIPVETPEAINGVISVDGKEYASVEEAFKNLTSGAQVKLLADADVMRYTEIAQNCTIDLNGHKLTVHPFNQNADHQKDKGDYWCVVKILEGVKVDVIDSSAEKTGTLSQSSSGSFNAGFLVFGEMAVTDILVDNQNTDDGALILTFNTAKSRVVADNIHLVATNKGAIFNGGSEAGTTVLKNITETFDGQKDTLLQSDGITSPAYIIENCHFTDAGSSRRLSNNVTIRNTTWEFTQGGKLNIEAYGVLYDAVLENSTITTANSSEAVFVKYYKSAVLKNTTVKNTDGYAVNFQNELINPYTIESGTYEGKDYAVITDTMIYVNGGQFKGAQNAVNGQVILPKGKTLALTDGYYKLVDGNNNPFEDAAGKDAAVYDSDGSLLGGVDLVAGAPMLFLPNSGKVVLQKDVAVTGAVHLSMLNGGRYTFDLNGHKVDLSKANDAIFFFDKGTSVTFEDSVGTAVVDLAGPDTLQFGSTEGTGVIINGGTWNNGAMFGYTSQAHVVFAGGHFNVKSDPPMLCNSSPNFVVTGGDFNYDVSEAQTAPMYDPDKGWILGVVCDPVNHDTHDAYEKDGRWYVVPMSEMPAPDAPVITPESKSFVKGETIEVSMTATEGDIYYTLDGTKPTSNNTKYTAPFTVDQTTKVTAVVIMAGGRVSAFTEATYTMLTPEVKTGASEVAFGGEKAYDVTADVTILDGKITNVVLGNNATESGHANSQTYADNAKAMADGFKNVSANDKKAIEAVDGVTGATVTSDAYRTAVLEALGLNIPADLTFGSANTELQPGTYKVPVSLMNAGKHDKPSNAAAAFPAMATLTVAEDGSAVLESTMHPVTIGPITDMAYNVLVYQADNSNGETLPATVLESMVKPESMPEAGKEVPTKISFNVPNNDWDGVYLNFTVDAMGPGYPDAWLRIDYANAKVPGAAEHFKGSAKVNQFGKYTIHTDVTVVDGVIAGVDVTADTFISETHKPTNLMKIDQVTKALKNAWNGMAPTQENAEKIFKTIMKETNPDEVIDGVSGATYSAKAVRDAVMDAFKLEYQDEIINVPESVEPGIYNVEIGYYSDVVWHSLVENVKSNATLTVNYDGTMILDFETKSGTDKEPLYILGFNGVYPNNDRTQKLTMDGCNTVMGLSSNDYEDEFFAKGTQVVNHVTFPLLGGLSKIYTTNAYLYVPAMKRLNGELSGVYFEDGHFNVDIFAKIYWDTMVKTGEPVQPEPELSEGWNLIDGQWAYIENGEMLTSCWIQDSMGWCYLGSDGFVVTNCWAMDSQGWCYLDETGHLKTNAWQMDSQGWCYLDETGHIVTNAWRQDSHGWVYLGEDGRMVRNAWVMDSQGWCYVGDEGYMLTNTWAMDSQGWCYLDETGHLKTNSWQQDSHGWVYLGEDGHMVYNTWMRDSNGLVWIGSDGYAQ